MAGIAYVACKISVPTQQQHVMPTHLLSLSRDIAINQLDFHFAVGLKHLVYDFMGVARGLARSLDPQD